MSAGMPVKRLASKLHYISNIQKHALRLADKAFPDGARVLVKFNTRQVVRSAGKVCGVLVEGSQCRVCVMLDKKDRHGFHPVRRVTFEDVEVVA